MLSAFLHGYLLSFDLILLLDPQNELVFSQRATPPADLADTTLILSAVLIVPWVIIWISAVYLVYNLTRM